MQVNVVKAASLERRTDFKFMLEQLALTTMILMNNLRIKDVMLEQIKIPN